MPDYTEEDKFDYNFVSEYMMNSFVSNWEEEKMNDKGNRNLCRCENKIKDSICKKHDLWHIYSAGRMGATLYWDKYYNDGRFNIDEYDLEQMPISELRTILKEVRFFNRKVEELMESFYRECEYQLEQTREEQKVEQEEETEYQSIKKQVIEKQIIKRLISEIIA